MRLLQHLLGRVHAVVEAEPAVDVEEHGSWIDRICVDQLIIR
jgi:hypothetical protein